jgi:hypothetical protein
VYANIEVLHWISKRRRDIFLQILTWKSCYKKNDVALFTLRDFSQLLRKLLIEQNSRERDFHRNIRFFNFVFTFTFVNYKVNSRIANRLNNDREFVVFQIQNELYHLQEFLQSFANNTFAFVQLLFYDSNEMTTTWNV